LFFDRLTSTIIRFVLSCGLLSDAEKTSTFFVILKPISGSREWSKEINKTKVTL